MEKSQLLYAVTVAKHQNFTKAAKELNISQPSLSNQIIKLENELKITLFVRESRSVDPTEAGEAFVFYANKLLNNWAELESLMHDFSSLKSGKLCIGATPIMEIFNITTLIANFQKLYPHISITLLQTGSTALLKALKNKDIDVAFVVSSPNNPELISEDLTSTKLREDLLCAIMSKQNPLSYLQVINVKNLSNENLILPTGTNTLQKIIKKHFEVNHSIFKPAYSCDQTDAALAFAAANLGVYFGTADIPSHHNYNQLASIPLDPPIYRDFSIVTSQNLQYHPVLKSFVDFIVKNKNLCAIK